ncbi:MAG: DUF177 domain-containing protein [Bacteroidetes bacterium]|nr:DUF177 domain-containing protein [Bacteroidota bacterium]
MAKSQYIIQFGGLSIGEHEFEFEVKGAFFEQFKDSEIEQADVSVKLLLIKQNNLLQMEFDIEGTVAVSCDRCLKEFDYPIEAHENLVIKHGDPAESNDEILVLKEGNDEADISQYLYEYITLALPNRRVPCEDLEGDIECDYETLNKLEENRVDEEPNPQWEQLKKIKFSNN